MLLQPEKIYENTVSTDTRLWDVSDRFDKYGFSGSLTWRTGMHTLVAGTDLLNGRFKSDFFPEDVFEQRKYAFFTNDTISVDKLTITPGLRYDHTNLGDDVLSPSLGLTYLATKDLLLRAVVSRGFHDPSLANFIDNPNGGFIADEGLESEKIWSYQAGAEANLFDLLRAKLTLFYHDIDDILVDKDLGNGTISVVNGGKARTTGGEFEITTKKFWGLVLKSGFHYERIKRIDFSDIRLFDVQKIYDVNASLTYNEDKGLRAILKAHYLWWNYPKFWGAVYNGTVVDFNIIKDILKKKDSSLEVFFTGHNLLNGRSSDNDLTLNPNRWIEAGVRYSF
jgi:outer membrane receptor for ferrienterochelin and colicin